MKSPIQIIWRLSMALALAAVLALFAVAGASAAGKSGQRIIDPPTPNRLVDDSFRDSAKGSIIDPAVRNRLVDDSFRDSTNVTLRTGSIVDPAVRNRLVDDSFRDRTGAGYDLGRYAIVQPTRQASGFDWGDAGIGAAALLGLVLLTGGTGLVVRRRRTLAHA